MAQSDKISIGMNSILQKQLLLIMVVVVMMVSMVTTGQKDEMVTPPDL